MIALALVLAALAALVHVYIFVLESLLFDRPSTWRVFGIASASDAAVLKPVFLNQGFYNLFLAVVTFVGIALADKPLVAAGTAPMLGAALVLAISNRALLRSAVVQGLFPALALVALLFA